MIQNGFNALLTIFKTNVDKFVDKTKYSESAVVVNKVKFDRRNF